MSCNIMATKVNIIIIGTGPMAVAYVNVLRTFSVNICVVGRGANSAATFKEQTGIVPLTGGIAAFFESNIATDDTLFIIATGTEALMSTLLQVVSHAPMSKVLIEKPAAISIEELLNNKIHLTDRSKIFVAYNRRFYYSVIEAQRLIEADGGLLSMQFEFTEWVHKIEPLMKAPGVKENWFFANSTHVIDLAFYFAGRPEKFFSFVKSGAVHWHPTTNFAGSGITEKGVLFTYLSNWESAGRWSIELLTSKRRLYLRPLEGLAVQLKGSIDVQDVKIEDQLDTLYKPGLYRQVESFLSADHVGLLPLSQHIVLADEVYSKILGNR